jgi:hypothetical protein
MPPTLQFREFVVYVSCPAAIALCSPPCGQDGEQCYPEYLLTYRRQP